MAVGTWSRAEAGKAVNYSTLVRIVGALGLDADAVDSLVAGFDPFPRGIIPEPPDGDDPPPGGAAVAPEPLQIAALAGEMTPEQRTKVEAYMRGLLDSD